MPIIVLRVDSNTANRPSNIIPYPVKAQPIRLKMISINFYNPADDTELVDLYTRNLYVDFSFLNSFSIITNGSLGGHGIVVPVKRNEASQIITGIDFRFEPHEDIDINFQADIFARHSPTFFEKYSGYYTDPSNLATKVDVHVNMAFFFEYDVLDLSQ
jgi:hypothetical protein